MNFLAHLYLSGEDDDVLIGNFIADGIKGKRYENFPPKIKTGILLHRFIDDFTDTHPICLESKVLFRPRYHKLAPILVDIVYDHFLAKNWSKYHPLPLRNYVDRTYALLQSRFDDLTPPIQHMLPYMVQHDWLYNYQFKEGMENVLHGMSRRVKEGEVLKHGWEDLEQHQNTLQEHFTLFFEELKSACAQKLVNLQQQ